MRSLFVRTLCAVVNALLGDTSSAISEADERTINLARSRDPYFHAFRARCMEWVYGDDPRRSLEREAG